MSKVQYRFSKFLSNLELSSVEIQEVQNKYEDICKMLHRHYYYLNYDKSTRIIIGSFGKNTAITPLTDIDVLFILPNDEFSKYDRDSGNGQLKLLQDIKKILLKKHYFSLTNEEDSTVVVNFVSFNVRVKPAFLRTANTYTIPNVSNGGFWRVMCPEAEKSYLYNSNTHSKGNTVRLIKMLKAWKNHGNVPIKSFALELSAVNFLSEWKYFDEHLSYYDWMIRDYFGNLFTLMNKSYDIAGVEEKFHFGDSWLEAMSSAIESASNACIKESEMNHTLATQEWVRIFGIKFPF